jgi:hypothetical protein
MRFNDFLIYDEAATALYDDPNSQHKCRDCLCRLSETASRHPGMFSEAASKDVRKGVAFRQKSLDDLEHGVFGQRLAQKLWKQPEEPDKGKRATKPGRSPPQGYGDFLRQSVHQQGDVLGDMVWDDWEVTRKALELGGVDPAVLADPQMTPAQRLATATGRPCEADIGRPLPPGLRSPGPATRNGAWHGSKGHRGPFRSG